ncbi:hypothetical protein RchiOBHm_Chr7g0200951 [Rosa chinensis]|uniref:Uncharacterized protein n=1 Tax=Rosa chinensis TaxID=74649 RepID=A0A2P6P7T6_ROSCH|nr:hypothetical protein RchiOBHm_Chr7g0200951 [Rosa chinensis]
MLRFLKHQMMKRLPYCHRCSGEKQALLNCVGVSMNTTNCVGVSMNTTTLSSDRLTPFVHTYPEQLNNYFLENALAATVIKLN